MPNDAFKDMMSKIVAGNDELKNETVVQEEMTLDQIKKSTAGYLKSVLIEHYLPLEFMARYGPPGGILVGLLMAHYLSQHDPTATRRLIEFMGKNQVDASKL